MRRILFYDLADADVEMRKKRKDEVAWARFSSISRISVRFSLFSDSVSMPKMRSTLTVDALAFQCSFALRTETNPFPLFPSHQHDLKIKIARDKGTSQSGQE